MHEPESVNHGLVMGSFAKVLIYFQRSETGVAKKQSDEQNELSGVVYFKGGAKKIDGFKTVYLY